MKSTVEDLKETANQDAQVAAPAFEDTQGNVAEWTSDCLLTMRSPIRFSRADWP